MCARIDLLDELNKVNLELERTPSDAEERHNRQRLKQLEVKDMHEYGKSDYFTLASSRPIDEVSVVDGMKVPRRAYMRYEYKCNRRRHGITVDMPWYAYEKMEKTNDSTTKKNT